MLALFLLIGAGVLASKRKLLRKEAVKSLTDIVLYFATPCVIISSFQRPFQRDLLSGLFTSFVISLLVHVGSILLAHLAFRRTEEGRTRVLRFSTVFSNAGYMALPLQYAVLGQEGVFYGACYVAVFNLVVWTYGLFTMGGGRRELSLKQIVFNPGIVGVVIGFVLFVTSTTLPTVLAAPIEHLANLNTPIPMLIIGYYLAEADLLKALRDKHSYLAIGLRLVVIPLLTLGLAYACGVRGTVLVASVIGASAPVAVATTMFATKYEQDTALSVNLVTLSTLLSALSMPLIVGLAQALA